MPLTNFQRKVLRVVSENRSPDSYVAGGSALNAERCRRPLLARYRHLFRQNTPSLRDGTLTRTAQRGPL